ncbi:hypothetical protein B0A53_04297 [Rhodotorula sp. CCFEE 5036]|nr:hypothetical protein B0A53_04297 [Rhodotorula sp. CCFEE 5036]
MAQDVPSPTKRATRAPAPPAERDPTDPRGSLKVTTGLEDLIRQRAMEARAGNFKTGVNWGHATSSGLPAAAPRRRPLGFSRTEPVLSFANASNNAPPSVASWQSGKDILDEVYAHAALTGKRSDELRPMWETGSATDTAPSVVSASGRRQDSGFFGAAAAPSAGHSIAAVGGGLSDDGDGFDLDEAFGSAGAGRFAFGTGAAFAGGVQEDSQDSSRTVTQRLKRAFDDDNAGQAAAAADADEMDATDIEDDDEGVDMVAAEPMSMFGTATSTAAGPRRLAGLKRGFHKTQSLPPSAFAGKMEF